MLQKASGEEPESSLRQEDIPQPNYATATKTVGFWSSLHSFNGLPSYWNADRVSHRVTAPARFQAFVRRKAMKLCKQTRSRGFRWAVA